jgi:opacity protein-like surface antigen
LLDISAVAFMPVSDSKFKLYGKAGLADVYSRGSLGAANNLGLTYGAGVEFSRDTGIVRIGFQHFNVGNGTLSPSLSTNLIGLTLLLK